MAPQKLSSSAAASRPHPGPGAPAAASSSTSPTACSSTPARSNRSTPAPPSRSLPPTSDSCMPAPASSSASVPASSSTSIPHDSSSSPKRLMASVDSGGPSKRSNVASSSTAPSLPLSPSRSYGDTDDANGTDVPSHPHDDTGNDTNTNNNTDTNTITNDTATQLLSPSKATCVHVRVYTLLQKHTQFREVFAIHEMKQRLLVITHETAFRERVRCRQELALELEKRNQADADAARLGEQLGDVLKKGDEKEAYAAQLADEVKQALKKACEAWRSVDRKRIELSELPDPETQLAAARDGMRAFHDLNRWLVYGGDMGFVDRLPDEVSRGWVLLQSVAVDLQAAVVSRKAVN